jgi:two-component system, OmpR family, response regulator AdeR
VSTSTTATGQDIDRLVLIVEDDEDLAVSMSDVLEAEGYATAVASDGRKALDDLEARIRPDLILLDLTMPLMDGWSFRAEQAKRTEIASIPVVVVTADGHAPAKAQALRADGYLAKPVTIERLLEEVDRLCRRA